MRLFFAVLLFFATFLSCFKAFLFSNQNNIGHSFHLHALSRKGKAEPAIVKETIPPGSNIPPELANDNAIYDMILVERLSTPETTTVGLFLPKIEGKDQKHLGYVLSVPQGYGLESEQGRIQPLEVSRLLSLSPFSSLCFFLSLS